MPVNVCMLKNLRDPECASAREWVCVCVYLLLSAVADACTRFWLMCCWFVANRLFPLPLPCQSATDDGQLICGAEISVLERGLCRRRATEPSRIGPIWPRLLLTGSLCQSGNEDMPGTGVFFFIPTGSQTIVAELSVLNVRDSWYFIYLFIFWATHSYALEKFALVLLKGLLVNRTWLIQRREIFSFFPAVCLWLRTCNEVEVICGGRRWGVKGKKKSKRGFHFTSVSIMLDSLVSRAV